MKPIRKILNTKKSTQIVDYFSIEQNYSIDTAKMIAAVSAHETGFWKSRLYRQNHNLFGMKFPTVRNTTALGEKDGFAFYQNNQNAIKDFFFYLSYFGYKTDYGGDLFKFVWEMKENAYFEEDFNAYYKKVSGVYFQLFSKE